MKLSINIKRGYNMNNMTFTDYNGLSWARVNKTTARREYDKGANVVLCPSNLRPFTPWGCEAKTNNYNGYDFDTLVNAFKFYNCVNRETGRGVNFFVVAES